MLLYSLFEVVCVSMIRYETGFHCDDLTLDLEGYGRIDKNIVLPNPNAPTGIAPPTQAWIIFPVESR